MRPLYVVILGSVLAGCSTMMPTTSTQSVHISSAPPEASVVVDGTQQSGTTPMTVQLDPRRTHDVRVEKMCYTAPPVTLEPSLQRRDLFLTVYDLSRQLPPTVHVDLTPTCAAGRRS